MIRCLVFRNHSPQTVLIGQSEPSIQQSCNKFFIVPSWSGSAQQFYHSCKWCLFNGFVECWVEFVVVQPETLKDILIFVNISLSLYNTDHMFITGVMGCCSCSFCSYWLWWETKSSVLILSKKHFSYLKLIWAFNSLSGSALVGIFQISPKYPLLCCFPGQCVLAELQRGIVTKRWHFCITKTITLEDSCLICIIASASTITTLLLT